MYSFSLSSKSIVVIFESKKILDKNNVNSPKKVPISKILMFFFFQNYILKKQINDSAKIFDRYDNLDY